MKISGREVVFGNDGSFATVMTIEEPVVVAMGRSRLEAIKKLIDKLAR